MSVHSGTLFWFWANQSLLFLLNAVFLAEKEQRLVGSQWDMSFRSGTLFWFRANQSLLFLLNAVCLAEKQQIPILKSSVWSDRGLNPWSTALEASMLTIMLPLLVFGVLILNCPPFNIFNFWIRVIPSLDIYLLVIQIAYFFQLCKSTETRHNFFHNIEANLKIGKFLIFCQYIQFANTIRPVLRGHIWGKKNGLIRQVTS